MTSVISPFGASANRAASSAADPRTTSSNRFVSSRHTATSRSGSAAASERSVAGSRRGDSKATTGHAHARSSSQSAASSAARRGRKPTNAYRSADEPARDERRLDRRGPGQHRHGSAGGERRPHERRAGIGDPGQPGVRDERDPLARLEPRAAPRRRARPRCARGARAAAPRSRAARAGAAVCRVSSQSTTSAARSSSSTRSVTSPRLPIGVAQTASGIAAPTPAPRTRRARRRSRPAVGPSSATASRTRSPPGASASRTHHLAGRPEQQLARRRRRSRRRSRPRPGSKRLTSEAIAAPRWRPICVERRMALLDQVARRRLRARAARARAGRRHGPSSTTRRGRAPCRRPGTARRPRRSPCARPRPSRGRAGRRGRHRRRRRCRASAARGRACRAPRRATNSASAAALPSLITPTGRPSRCSSTSLEPHVVRAACSRRRTRPRCAGRPAPERRTRPPRSRAPRSSTTVSTSASSSASCELERRRPLDRALEACPESVEHPGEDLRPAEVDPDHTPAGHPAGTLLRRMAPDDKPYRVYRGGRVKGKVPAVPGKARPADGRRAAKARRRAPGDGVRPRAPAAVVEAARPDRALLVLVVLVDRLGRRRLPLLPERRLATRTSASTASAARRPRSRRATASCSRHGDDDPAARHGQLDRGRPERRPPRRLDHARPHRPVAPPALLPLDPARPARAGARRRQREDQRLLPGRRRGARDQDGARVHRRPDRPRRDRRLQQLQGPDRRRGRDHDQRARSRSSRTASTARIKTAGALPAVEGLALRTAGRST